MIAELEEFLAILRIEFVASFQILNNWNEGRMFFGSGLCIGEDLDIVFIVDFGHIAGFPELEGALDI